MRKELLHVEGGTTAGRIATASERSYCRTTEGVRSYCRKDGYYSYRRKAPWQEELNATREDLMKEEGTILKEGGATAAERSYCRRRNSTVH